MHDFSTTSLGARIGRLRSYFVTRDVIFHDGRALRRFRIPGHTQAAAAAIGALALGFSMYGATQAAAEAATMAGLLPADNPQARVARMEAKVTQLQAKVEAVRTAARLQAAKVEQRQALIAAVLTGQGDPSKFAAPVSIDPRLEAAAGDVIAPLKRVEAIQGTLAAQTRAYGERRYVATAERLRKLGIAPERVMPARGAIGGPFVAVNSTEAAADIAADAQFHSLFQTWKKLDGLQQGVISIPSVHPVNKLTFTSNFGVRSDPFRGTAAFHAGVDIPGAIGTPIYATADGMVDRAERAGGYGNLVEIDHGRGINTRYGHLSKILVTPGAQVKRGQLIALMGSTGRSTGSHLHYEVRIDGHAVNPAPFLETADYFTAAKNPNLTIVPVNVGAAGISED